MVSLVIALADRARKTFSFQLSKNQPPQSFFTHTYAGGQSDSPPAIGTLEQGSQLAGIFFRRHDQFSLEFSRPRTQSLDVLARIGVVVGIDHFIKDSDPYSLNESSKRSGMTHAATEQSSLSFGPGEGLQ